MLSDTEAKIRDGIYEALVDVFRSCIIRYDIGNKTPKLLVNKNYWIDIFFLLLHNTYLNDFIDNADKKNEVLDDLKNDISAHFNTTDYESVARIVELFEDKLDLFVNLLQRRKKLIVMIAERNWLLDVNINKKSDLENWVTAENEVEQYLHLRLDDNDAMQKLQQELKAMGNVTLVFINKETVVYDEVSGKFPDTLIRKSFKFV